MFWTLFTIPEITWQIYLIKYFRLYDNYDFVCDIFYPSFIYWYFMCDFEEQRTSLSESVCKMFLSLGKPSSNKFSSNWTLFFNCNGIWASEISVSSPESKNISINADWLNPWRCQCKKLYAIKYSIR